MSNEPTRWEYCITFKEDINEFLLNYFGEDGWELVNVESWLDGRQLIFKRPVNEDFEK
ncbi:MAG: hypothetical protein P4L79_09920 [Legionella sp.]|uniref:hypothetical protein n=1 Tax=Legionella sp. TaxID=459 RepID=UPI00284B3699|nr:hypothetical protein [Legionella sp.]